MLKSVIIVVVLLIALCYAAVFLTWNGQTKVDLVTWRLGGEPWWVQGVPAGLLPAAGAVIGAIATGVGLSSDWPFSP